MAMPRPNIILITTDQQRWDAIGVHNPAIRTPAIDSLAHQGINFTQSYCAATACQPSRASIMTGLYPPAHGVIDTGAGKWLSPDQETFAARLTKTGYRSCAVGKMHAIPWDHPCDFERRVVIESKYSQQNDDYRQHLKNQGLSDEIIGHHTPGFAKANKGMASSLCPDDHIDGYIGRRSSQALHQLVTEQHQASDPTQEHASPFLLWVSFCGPHDPYDPPAPYDKMYNPADMPLPCRAVNELDHLPPSIRQRTESFGVDKLKLCGISDQEHQRLRALYYGNVTFIDTCIQRLLDQLDQANIADNTLVIFTSDHADFLGDHDLLWKAFLPSDADMRVPLIMRWPAAIKPQQSDAFASGVDLMPTILAAAQAGPPTATHGKNLLDPQNTQAASRDHLLMFGQPCHWRWRDKHWSYTHWPDQPFGTLYDLSNDPHELNNLLCPSGQHPMALQLHEKMKTDLATMSPPCTLSPATTHTTHTSQSTSTKA